MLGTIAGLLVLIWFLQIFFLNQYYTDMKIERTRAEATEMLALLEANDMDSFIKTADDIVTDNDVYICFERNGVILYPALPSTLYEQEILSAKSHLAKNLSEGDRDYTTTFSNEDEKARTYVYTTALSGDDTAILTVISPLYPIKSTVEILQNQLIYIILVSLGVGFLVAYYLSTRITEPIIRLTDSARKLSEGEYGTEFPTDRKSFTEIKELSTALNTASIELGKSAALQKDIMANVSHDLRTPLTMIKSYAEMIRDLSGDNPEKRNAHLQVIIDESDRLGTLVSDLMALSQLQAGTLTMNIEPFDITEAARAILTPYKILEANGYSLEFNAREDFMVLGDEERIKQVISNLLTNAIKYCGTDKKVIINIRRWGKKCHFEIIDHGVGIKPEELDHIWERYQRSSSHHVRDTGGSGLGLSIVSQILTLHDAKYGAESRVGRGTTFWFELPIYVPPEPRKAGRNPLFGERVLQSTDPARNRKTHRPRVN